MNRSPRLDTTLRKTMVFRSTVTSAIYRPAQAVSGLLYSARFHSSLPPTQKASIIRSQSGPVEFLNDYPVPKLGYNEVLAKILYTGVCQSGKSVMSSV